MRRAIRWPDHLALFRAIDRKLVCGRFGHQPRNNVATPLMIIDGA
jgi:hypothetical protein